MFGSRSGFDTIEECFGDLSSHIFACETGSVIGPAHELAGERSGQVRLISNSDAHSRDIWAATLRCLIRIWPLGAVRRALETHDLNAYKGTLDMYPHQGKYHYDGHRKCGCALIPTRLRGFGRDLSRMRQTPDPGRAYRVRNWLTGRRGLHLKTGIPIPIWCPWPIF